MTIKLIVGLRNPGSAYEHTRHNVGEWFVELLTKRYNFTLKTEKQLQAEVGQFVIQGQVCKVMLPLTFMNLSGHPIQAVTNFYKIKPQEILIAHDDLDLVPGRIKLKTDGGHGGHNGLRDTIQKLGQSDFHRLRIGIGHPGHKDLVTNYVLGKPSQVDRQHIYDALEKAISAIPTVIHDTMQNAMNQLNT